MSHSGKSNIVQLKEWRCAQESIRGGDIGFRDSETDLFCPRDSEIFYFSFQESEILLASETEIILLGLPRY